MRRPYKRRKKKNPNNTRDTINHPFKIKKSEFLGTVSSSSTFAYTYNGLRLNPVSPLFPWVSTIAMNFERYAFRKLNFRYVPTTTSYGSKSGFIACCAQYDNHDAYFSGKQQFLNYAGAKEYRVTHPFVYRVNVSQQTTKKLLIYPASGLGSNIDSSLYDLGSMYVVTGGAAIGDPVVELGELYVDYEIDFYIPKDADLSTEIFSPVFAATSTPEGSATNLGPFRNLAYPSVLPLITTRSPFQFPSVGARAHTGVGYDTIYFTPRNSVTPPINIGADAQLFIGGRYLLMMFVDDYADDVGNQAWYSTSSLNLLDSSMTVVNEMQAATGAAPSGWAFNVLFDFNPSLFSTSNGIQLVGGSKNTLGSPPTDCLQMIIYLLKVPDTYQWVGHVPLAPKTDPDVLARLAKLENILSHQVSRATTPMSLPILVSQDTDDEDSKENLSVALKLDCIHNRPKLHCVLCTPPVSRSGSKK